MKFSTFNKIALTIVLTVMSSGIFAATIKWTGSAGKWHDAKNWSPAQVPGKTDDVIFDSKNMTKVIIDQPVEVKKLEVTANVKGIFKQLADITITDFILAGGKWYAGKENIICRRNFLIESTGKFFKGASTLAMTGTGSLKVMYLNNVIMAFKGHTTTLLRSLYPINIELRGGTLSGKTGITYYDAPKSMKGFSTTKLELRYITIRASKPCFMTLPSLTMNGKLYLNSINTKAVYNLEKGSTLNVTDLGICGNRNGTSELVLDGGNIIADRIYIGSNKKDSAGGLRLYGGKLTLKTGLYLYNKNSSVVLADEFPKPKIKLNQGSVTTE
ncbi:MAG: hypothetical protein L3J71_12980 [Victivallaceae bacterium]|nr:hypothetical protein [Victivallaceae bacterium]